MNPTEEVGRIILGILDKHEGSVMREELFNEVQPAIPSSFTAWLPNGLALEPNSLMADVVKWLEKRRLIETVPCVSAEIIDKGRNYLSRSQS